MLKKFVSVFGGDPNKRKIKKFSGNVDLINSLEAEFEVLSDEALCAKTDAFRRRLVRGETLDDILPEAFATVREASKRTIGLRHYDIQLVGGVALHQGTIAEMRTGEGKTLVATLPLYLNALTFHPDWLELAQERWGSDPDRWVFKPFNGIPVNRGVHLVTVNDYLARRDARWKAPIYNLLGMDVGVLQMAARTEYGAKAFLIDLEKSSPHEDQHQLMIVPRKESYAVDITYGTTSEYGFDYLRDNMKMRFEERVQRGYHYAIIDEVDNVLIDEARTPLIISGPSHDDAEHYIRMAQVVKRLDSQDYEIDERSRTVSLTEIGEINIEQILGESLRDPERPEDITPEQAQTMGYLEQALRAQNVFRRNKDYLVQGGKVVIIDEYTGRLMPGRRWSDGLHQAVEAKEGVKVQGENVTYATITIQNYFRMYDKLSGMTGTAATEAEEFHKIYNLDVIEIPTNLDYQASHSKWALIDREATDEEGYRYTYYVSEDNLNGDPLFWKRKDYPDVIYRSEEAKFRAIGQEILRYHTMGRPMLVGTTSVELSELLTSRLKADPMRKLTQILLLRHTWMEANDREMDGRQIPELEFLNCPLGLLPKATMKKMARELGLSLNPQTSENLDRLLEILKLSPEHKDRLGIILKNGVSHQVLNARKHTEESQIIADAGAYGAVTIATNMAGRGVDIKLGGELPEEVLTQVNRVLNRAGYEDPYDMTLNARQAAFLDMTSEDYGIYEAEVNQFLKYIQESKQVKDLGGLHVIGSERHESRRIDNQLRGRSARQGDPGSSRFYLSMQDQLMRLFGGQQAEGMMERLKIDEDMPIEMGMVSRIVEQSQTRVEGANFDTRKHLLEYDDVLNKQRASIYGQRDRIFVKGDLSEDVNELIQVEVKKRVPEALVDEEGPWKLLAWLDQTQPTLIFGDVVFPSFTVQLLLEHLKSRNITDRSAAFNALIDIGEGSLNAEDQHFYNAIDDMVDQTGQGVKHQIKERLDTLDIFFEGLSMEDETDTRNPREIQNDLLSLLRVPIKLSPQHQRALRDDPDEIVETIGTLVETYLVTEALRRIVIVVERRLEEMLDLSFSDLLIDDWDATVDQILEKIESANNKRRRRLLGDNQDGLIAKDLKTALAQVKEPPTDYDLINLLLRIPQGSRATFDRKSRRRVWKRTTRLTYTYYAPQFLQDIDEETATQKVLDHLLKAQGAMRSGLGAIEFNRFVNTSADLPKIVRNGLRDAFGDEAYQRIENQPLKKLASHERNQVIDEFGRQVQTANFRNLLLSVISNLWVDYLTQMEGLRVSVGLEAYAQRDPLVMYKRKASEMFQTLLKDMRVGVVSRMFTYQAISLITAQMEEKQTERALRDEPRAESPRPQSASVQADGQDRQDGHRSKSQKRRRRRRYKKKRTGN